MKIAAGRGATHLAANALSHAHKSAHISAHMRTYMRMCSERGIVSAHSVQALGRGGGVSKPPTPAALSASALKTYIPARAHVHAHA
eukprot:17400-Chlamydomonas_euryale.AAC.1